MKRPVFYGWVVVVAGLVVWAGVVGMLTTFGVFFKPIAEEFGWNRGMTSGARALITAVIGVLSPFAGILVDRYGPRVLILGCGILTGLGYILLSQIEAVWQFYIFSLPIGLAMGMGFTPIAATISRWFQRKRSLALGITMLGSGIGTMILPPVANHLISVWGWRSSYAFLGTLSAGAIVASSFFFRRDPAEMGLNPDGGEGQKIARVGDRAAEDTLSLRQVLATSAFWRVSWAYAVALTSFVLITTHLVPYATDLGISPADAALVVSAFGVSNSFGRLGLGFISDRVGKKKVLYLCLGWAGLGMLLLVFSSKLWMFYLVAILVGMTSGGALINVVSIQGELFGMAAVGAVIGATEAGADYTAGAGAFLAGYAFDVTGGYGLALALSALSLFLASALVFTLIPPQRRR